MKLRKYPERIACSIRNEGEKDFWRIEEQPANGVVDIRLWTHLEGGGKHATRIGAAIPYDRFDRMMPIFKMIEEKLFVQKIREDTLAREIGGEEDQEDN